MTANTLAKKIRSQHWTSDYKEGMAALRKLLAHPSDPSDTSDRTCVYCGCTDTRACPDGCCWVMEFPHANAGVCSSCIAPTPKVKAALEMIGAVPSPEEQEKFSLHYGRGNESCVQTCRRILTAALHLSHSSHKSHQKSHPCKGCGSPVSPESDHCGECLCEEESL